MGSVILFYFQVLKLPSGCLLQPAVISLIRMLLHARSFLERKQKLEWESVTYQNQIAVGGNPLLS